MRLILSFILVLLFLSSAQAKTHPYDLEFENVIQQNFYDKGIVSLQKIYNYISVLEQKHQEIVGLDGDRLQKNSVLINKYRKERLRDSDIIEKLQKHKVHIALKQVISELASLNRTSSQAEVYGALYRAMNVENALKIEGDRNIFHTLGQGLEAITVSWKVKKKADPSKEASNLIVANKSDKYLGLNDIQLALKSGADLSFYEPGHNSTFWQKQKNISSIDVQAAAMGKTLDLYKGVDIEFPADKTFVYEGMRYSDKKPKMDVVFRNAKGKKRKVKLKVGEEMHADPTLAAVMATLGYPVDITKYVRDIKVYLGKKTLDDLRKEWEIYYKRDRLTNRFLIEDYISSEGSDRDGNYIIFKEGLLEAKPKKIERLGGWDMGVTSHDSFREVRALMMLQIWLDNGDTTNYVNNRLLFKENGDGSLQPYHIISDPGAALGYLMVEKPELYFWDLVSSNTNSSITLRYLSVPLKIKNKITYADARWAIRLLATMTRKQIEDAVRIGGWQECIRKIYTERMISRRNDLVKNFNVLGEKDRDGKTIGLLVQAYSREEMKLNKACKTTDQKDIKENYTQDFKFAVSDLVRPILLGLKNGAIDISQGLINSVNGIQIQPKNFDLNLSMVTEIILNPSREIEQNPAPTSSEDLYIIKDRLEIGLSIGAKYGVYADTVQTIAYTLAYPARSVSEAKVNNGFLVNALLPLDVKRNKLPKSYVLETAHYSDIGVGLWANNIMNPAPIGARARFSPKALLWRSILDHRDSDNVIFYRDRADFSQTELELFARLGIFNLSFFKTLEKWGESKGSGVVFSSDELYGKRNMISLVYNAIETGDYTFVAPLEKKFDLTNSFDQISRNWSLLIWGSKTDKRMDHIRLSDAKSSKDIVQYSTSKQKSFNLLGNKEQKRISVQIYADTKKQEYFQMKVDVLGIDFNTKDNEMGEAYLGFINALHPTGHAVIPFTPNLGYSTNGYWGKVITTSETVYHPKALNKLLKVSDQQYWSTLAKVLKMSDKSMQNLRGNYRNYRSNSRSNLRTKAAEFEAYGLTRGLYASVFAAERFLKGLKSAREKKSYEKQLRQLAEAVRHAADNQRSGFFEPSLFAVMNRIVGLNNLYSRNRISSPQFEEINFVEEVPLYGEFGTPRNFAARYLIYTPVTPVEMYTMFDSWF